MYKTADWYYINLYCLGRGIVSLSVVQLFNQNENTPHHDILHIGIFTASEGEREVPEMAGLLKVR